MAITCIHPVSQTLIKSIRYACNAEKTEDGLWIQAYNCPQESLAAYRAMQESKSHYGKMDGVQGHSILFSFAPGEVEKEKAFEILNYSWQDTQIFYRFWQSDSVFMHNKESIIMYAFSLFRLKYFPCVAIVWCCLR